MHRMMKADTTRPTSTHLRAQQRRTDRWVKIYNRVRPHQALGQKTPAEIYRAKRSPQRSGLLSYGKELVVRRVRSNGQIKWRGRKRFVGEAFIGYAVGMKRVRKDESLVYFADLLIGQLLESDPGGIRPSRYRRRN
jgi:hypothetical protein